MSFLSSKVTSSVGKTLNGFSCPPCTKLTRMVRRLPAYELQVDGPLRVNLTFLDQELFSSTSSVTSLSQRSSHNILDLKKFQHDFTYACLTNSTDVDLNRFLPFRDQKETPDWVFLKGSTLIVMEFTTTRSTNFLTLQKAYNVKRATYESSLRDRLDQETRDGGRIKAVEYYILAVSPCDLVTNLPLAFEDLHLLADELCWRLSIAVSILSELESREIYIPEKTDLGEKKNLVREVFKSIKFDWEETKEHFSPFSEEMYNKWMTPATGADLDWAQKIINKSFEKSKEKLLSDYDIGDDQLSKNVLRARMMVQEYEDSLKGDHLRPLSDCKAPVQLPFWVPKYKMGYNLEWIDIGESINSTFMYWKSAFEEIRLGNVKGLILDLDRESKIIAGTEAIDKDEERIHRGLYHRVKVDVLSEDRLEVAKVGVEAKKFLRRTEVEQYRREKRKGFPLMINTADIDDWLKNREDFQFRDQNWSMHSETFSAIEYAANTHGVQASEFISNMCQNFLCTDIGIFCSMVSDIAVELSLSMKQHVKTSQFIIKKLAKFNVFLLIKPTDSTKSIFFSLLARKEDLWSQGGTTVFKFNHENDECVWTEFVSYKMSKLTNLVKCESMLLSLFGHWCEFYSVPPWMKTDIQDQIYTPVLRMLKLNLLTLLNDKHVAEEIMTLQRYIFMEGFVSYPLCPKPQKMIEKFPTIIRSRFEAWLIKKSLLNITNISKGSFTALAKDGQTQWTQLPHPFFDEVLPSPYHLINCFYLGYLKNKEESAEVNTLGQMYEKILKLEDIQPETDDFLGNLDPDEPKKHEFSPTLIKLSVAAAQKHLKSIHGGNSSVVEDAILSYISHEDLESFCTLKASSNFNQSWYLFDPTKKYRRCKVIEAMRSELDGAEEDTFLVCQLVPRSLTHLTSQKCMHIDIFRKPQHGGLREIYVLEIKARIVQKMIEDMARAVCKLFDSETMTNPDSKMRLPMMHSNTAKKEGMVTVATSDDAALWNQGHFVTKFAMMLCLFTPEYMHPFIIKTCQLWMRKKIMIDPNLMKVLAANSDFTKGSILDRMAKACKGSGRERWIGPRDGFITTRSGMMQGILHYTSSLFHTVYMIFYKSVATQYFQSRGIRSLITHMQSSDDSAVLLSLRPKESIKELLTRTSLIFFLKEFLGEYFGIYMSIKRTTNTLNAFEFNSEYFFGGNLYRPTFRWIAASLSVSEQESLAARQEEAANLLKDCLEGGASHFSTSVVQHGQALLHYRLLGSSVSPHFPSFRQEGSWSRDPAYGFFLMDNPLMAGLSGFHYNLWLTCKTTCLGLKYRLMLEQQISSENKDGKIKTLEVTNAGAFVGSTTVRYGDRKKWERVIENFNKDYQNIYEEFDENPELLYRRAESLSEIKKKLTLKLMSPGVMQSLSKGNALPKIIASSVYILSREVMTDSTSWFINRELLNKRKTCILRELSTLRKRLENKSEMLTEEQMQFLFPFKDDYEALQQVSSPFSDLSGHLSRTYPRSVKTKIVMQEGDKAFLFSPDRQAASKWFHFQTINAATRVKEAHWADLAKTFNWIRDDPFTTLEASPFTHQTQLQNFLARLDKSKRIIRLTGVPIKSSGGSSSITLAIKQGFFPGFQLSTGEACKPPSSKTEVCHILRMIMEYPYTDEVKLSKVIEVVQNSDIDLKPSAGPTRLNSLAIIKETSHYLEMKRSLEKNKKRNQILDLIASTKLGIIGHWTIRQTFKNDQYVGRGVWSGLLDDACVVLEFESDKLILVKCSNESALRKNLHLLKTFLKDLSYTVPKDSGSMNKLCFDGRGLNCLGQGVSVLIEKTSRFYYDSDQINDLQISIDSNLRLIRLQAKYEGSRFWYTVLNYATKDRDVLLYAKPDLSKYLPNSKALEKAWLEFSALDGRVAYNLLLSINDQWSKFPHIDQSEFWPWIRERVSHYLLGKSTSKYLKKEGLSPQVDPLTIESLMEMDFSFDDSIDDVIEGYENFDPDDFIIDEVFLQGIGEVTEHSHKAVENHPIWNGLINFLISETSIETFYDTYFNFRYINTQKGMQVRKICSLILSMREEDFEKRESSPEVQYQMSDLI